jgi:Fe-S cluster biogenesis protein NfuA
MFIQTETTPNPNSLKFLPGIIISKNKSIQFKNIEECKNAPLAQHLFKIDGVKEVFLGKDFITVTKETQNDWDILKTELLLTMTEFFSANLPIFIEEKKTKHHKTKDQNTDEDDITKEIREIIEERVRPAVAQDGGDIEFHEFKDGIVFVKLHGACSGCPSSTVTLKDGIENMLKYYVPEVKEVKQIES